MTSIVVHQPFHSGGLGHVETQIALQNWFCIRALDLAIGVRLALLADQLPVMHTGLPFHLRQAMST